MSACSVPVTHSKTQPAIINWNGQYDFAFGKSAVIDLEHFNLKKNDQLALMPGGPFISQQFSLRDPPVAIVTDNQYAFVITEENNKNNILLVIHFPDKGNATLVSRTLIGRQISNLYYANNKLLLVNKAGQLTLVDVIDLQQPKVLVKYKLQNTVQHVQFDGESAYILNGSRTLSLVNFSTNEHGKNEPVVLQQWQLPLKAHSFAEEGNTLWTCGHDGISVINLTGNRAVLSDHVKTTGDPVEIQLHDKLALVTDRKGGLVIFDITKKEKLQWKGSYNKRNAINHVSLKQYQIVSGTTDQDQSRNKIVAVMDNNLIMSIGINNPLLPSSGPVFKSEEPVVTANFLNNDALIATRHALQRIVMEESGNFSISPEGTNQGGSRRGVIRDNILYVADWFSGLHLYDISNPQQPRHISNYHTPGSSKGVALYGDYVLIGDDDQGLQIVDVKDPLSPAWVSELSPDAMARQGLAYTMKRVGHILYLADHRGGFHIIDLTDIHHPKRVGGYDTPGKSWGIEVHDQYVFVADDQSGLLVFDANDVTNPRPVAQFDPGGQAEDVAIQGNLAYVVFFDMGLYVLDISNPIQPQVIAHRPIPGNARGIELAGKLAYLTGWESGLHILDIGNPEAPRILSSYDTDGSAWGVNTSNGFAYVLDWWGGIKVIDVHDPANPTYVGQYQARGALQHLRARNRYLYAASDQAGLQVFDIKNPLNPIWTTGIDLEGHAQDIWHDDTRAYVAAGDGGVAILDILDPFYTRQLGQINTPGMAQQVRAWNDTLFIKDSKTGILVVDARNPQQPKEINRISITAHDLWVDDNAFWAATESGLSRWQHDDEYNAEKTRRYAISGGADWVRTQDDLLITAQRSGLVQIWQLTSQGLSAESEYQANEPLLDIQIKDHSVYLLGDKSGLMVIDIHTPSLPRLTMVYPSTGQYTGVEIAGGAAFFTGENRLASVTLLPDLHYVADPSGNLRLQLPANFPVGSYHLLKITSNGETQLFPNSVTFHRPGNNPARPILEKYRQMLKNSH